MINLDITEEIARNAEARRSFDLNIAEWVGWSFKLIPTDEPNILKGVWRDEFGQISNVIPFFSTDPAHAMDLLTKMGNVVLERDGSKWYCRVQRGMTLKTIPFIEASTPELAIARACLVLISHGIKREDL